MQDLIASVESALQTHNWYAALTLTLTLPDIAGRIDNPNKGSKSRYIEWFDKYVAHNYQRVIGVISREEEPNKVAFLSGLDCYALRCSYLHEGKSQIIHQRSRDVLDDFEFVIPPPRQSIHLIRNNNKLLLQVDEFCIDLLSGLRKWLKDIENDGEKQAELNTFLRIHYIRNYNI